MCMSIGCSKIYVDSAMSIRYLNIKEPIADVLNERFLYQCTVGRSLANSFTLHQPQLDHVSCPAEATLITASIVPLTSLLLVVVPQTIWVWTYWTPSFLISGVNIPHHSSWRTAWWI